MLKDGRVAARLPVRDLEKARAFYYSEKLGLEPAEEWPGGLLYRCGGSEFALFESAGTASGTHTQMGWTVDDIEATVSELRRRGLEFEQVEMPGITVSDGVAEIPGNFRAKAEANALSGSGTSTATSWGWAKRSADYAPPAQAEYAKLGQCSGMAPEREVRNAQKALRPRRRGTS